MEPSNNVTGDRNGVAVPAPAPTSFIPPPPMGVLPPPTFAIPPPPTFKIKLTMERPLSPANTATSDGAGSVNGGAAPGAAKTPKARKPKGGSKSASAAKPLRDEPARPPAPWLKEQLPTFDNIEPATTTVPGPRHYVNIGSKPAPRFSVDDPNLPRASTQLLQTSIAPQSKLDVSKERGFFLRKQFAKRIDELGDEVPWSHLLVPKKKRKVDEDEDAEEEPDDGRKVLVIHPGSRNIRIGRADDPLPLTLPHVLARKVGHVTSLAQPGPTIFDEQMSGDPDDPDGAAQAALGRQKRDLLPRYPASHLPHLNATQVKLQVPELENDLLTRAKKKGVMVRTGATSTPAVIKFNSEEPREGETITAENDRGHKDWTEVWRRPEVAQVGFGKQKDLSGGTAQDVGAAVYFGEEALNVPNFSYPATRPLPVGAPVYELRYPIKYGTPNTADYHNQESWLDDMESIWNWAAEKAGVPKSERSKWNVVVVLPDQPEKGAWPLIGRVVGSLGFKGVACIAESLAATYGTGYSQSLVVDMGDGKTSVAVVDEGFLVPSTRMVARYGSSDVSLLLVHFLLQVWLPFHRPMDPNLICDRTILDEIKERDCRAEGTGLGEVMKVIQYESREPEASTRKWTAKVYEEVCLAPLVYFYPSLIDYRTKLAGLPGYTDKPTWLDTAGKIEIEYMDEIVYEGKLPKRRIEAAEVAPAAEKTPDTPEDTTKGDGPAESANVSMAETPVSTVAPSLPVPGANVAAALETASNGRSVTPPAAPGTPALAAGEKGETSDPTVPLALDDLIVSALVKYYRYMMSNYTKDAEDRLRRIAENIILVGGGAQLQGMAEEISERVFVKLNETAILPPVVTKDGTGTEPPAFVNVIAANKMPRDVDGKIVCWKGGSVLGRMEAVKDMWVGWDEWQSSGAHRASLLRWGIPWSEPKA